MNTVAPCGIICDICLGFQRRKNRCAGCTNTGFKPDHCNNCRIKLCSEERVKDGRYCIYCSEFPCKLIKHLDKRYTTKYNESPIQNLKTISRIGIHGFINSEKEKWTCMQCGNLLCVHRDACLNCGAINRHFITHKGGIK